MKYFFNKPLNNNCVIILIIAYYITVSNSKLKMHSTEYKSRFSSLINKQIYSLKSKCEDSNVCIELGSSINKVDKLKDFYYVLLKNMIKKDIINKLVSNVQTKQTTVNLLNKTKRILSKKKNFDKLANLFLKSKYDFVFCIFTYNNTHKYIKHKLLNFVNKCHTNKNNLIDVKMHKHSKQMLDYIFKYIIMLVNGMYRYAELDSNYYNKKLYFSQIIGRVNFLSNSNLNKVIDDKILILNTPVDIVDKDIFEFSMESAIETNENVYVLMTIEKPYNCKFNKFANDLYIKPFTMYKIINSKLINKSISLTVTCLQDNFNKLADYLDKNLVVKGFIDLVKTFE